MENFLIVFNAVVPLLLLILIGVLLKKIKLISAEGFKAVDTLGAKFLCPVLIFNNIYTADLSTPIDSKLIIIMISLYLIIFFGGIFIVSHLNMDNKERATVVHGCMHGNNGIVGLPLITALCDPSKLFVYTVLFSISSPIINTLSVLDYAHFVNNDASFGKIVKKVLSSPYILGALLGFAARALPFGIPAVLYSPINSIAKAATTVCLISLGGSFVFSDLNRYKKEVITIVGLKTIVFPTLVILLCVVLNLRGVELLSYAVMIGCPCASATYSYAVSMGGDTKLGSQLVVYSTLTFIFTISVIIYVILQLNLV